MKQPKISLFIGLGTIGISLIIIFLIVVNPLSYIPEPVYRQPQHQQCIENENYRKMNDMDYNNKLNETETLSLTYFCNIVNIDYDRTFQTTELIASIGDLLLILGIFQTIISATWLTVAKVRERRNKKEEV
jgi:hypothetical protein